MSEPQFNPDDPRLTAYVLGELSDAERAAVEAQLAACPQNRRVVDELRDTTARLFEALQAEPIPALTEAQRQSIHRAAKGLAKPPAPEIAMPAPPTARRSGASRNRAAVTALVAVVTVSAATLVVLMQPWGTGAPSASADRGSVEQEQLLAWYDTSSSSTARRAVDFGDRSGVNQYYVVPNDNPYLAKDEVRQFEATPQPPVDILIASTNTSGVARTRSLELSPAESATQPSSDEKRGFSRSMHQPTSRPSAIATTPPSNAQPVEESAPVDRFGAALAPYGETDSFPAPPSTMPGKALAQQPGGGQAGAGAATAKQQQSRGRGGRVTSAPEAGYTITTHGNPAAAPDETMSNGPASGNGNYTPLFALGGKDGQRLSKSGPPGDQLNGSRGARPRFNIVGRDQWGNGVVGQMVDPEIFSSDLDVPFRHGSFELGIPQFERFAGLSVTELERLRRRERKLYESLREGESLGTEQYAPIVENRFVSPADQPLSTFGLDVDTAAYANVRRFLMDQRRWPPPDAVRIEELVNYFSYADPQPADEHPLRVTLEAAACPWDTSHRLVRIGVKGREIDLADRPPTSLVFLIDTSGSMRDDNKLPLVKESLRLLVREMTENDHIALVTYSTNAGLLLDSTSGEHAGAIMAVIDSLQANGSTNGEAGLKLAYEVASQHFIENGSNRVILCTDGDFNVGESADAPLVRMISEKRDTGVFLSICGFGAGNLKDAKLEQIADHGNGQYHYVDGIGQARKVFLNELSGMLYTIAKDVKLQVEFNPAQVAAYRLLGYENRALAAEDFNNDRIDAGDLGAGHSVTALYEIVPPGAVRAKPASETPGVDPLKYQESGVSGQESGVSLAATQRGARPPSDAPTPSRELLTVKVRYKPALPVGSRLNERSRLNEGSRLNERIADESVKLEFPLVDDAGAASPSADLEWAAAVASFGMILRNSAYRGQSSIEGVLELARGAKGNDPTGDRQEFIELVLQARHLLRKATGSTSSPPPELSSLDARQKASVGGRYHQLLDKFARPNDFDRYGGFYDAGHKAADRHGKHPAGYWVYVYPHWYIWGETTRVSEIPDAFRTP